MAEIEIVLARCLERRIPDRETLLDVAEEPQS